MKKKIFIRFFSVTLVAVLAMFICGIIAVNANADALMCERLKEETQLVGRFLKSEDDFQNFSAYEGDDAFRVTVLNLQGDVLYESETKSPLENHASREEFVHALNGSPAAVKRYSETFDCDMTYYAIKTSLADGREIVVRLAIKNSRINAYLGVALPILIAVLVLSLIVSLVASNVFSKNVSDRVSEIGASLKSLNVGNYRPIETNSSEPELFYVLSEINALNESAHVRIRKISDEHAKLNTVLANVSQGIIAVDENGKVVFANDAVLKTFDSAAEIKGKDLVYLIDDVALCEKIRRHLNENYQAEYTYKDKDLSVAVRRTEKQDENASVSSIVIITDVTGEKALQKQKSEFFANASHELKTPVTVMQGLSEIMLAKETLDVASKKQAERIHKESLRMSALISDMLKLGSLESGEAVEQPLADIDLKKVAQEVVVELSEEISVKRISVEITGEATVRADGAKIYELLQNLLSNAVHYNVENGKIAVTFSTDENGVTLRVSDTGIGIEKEHIPRLCERFYRVDKSRSKKTGGTGLGLAIVKHVCATYGAKLSIESEIGEGTTVTVAFPKG